MDLYYTETLTVSHVTIIFNTLRLNYSMMCFFFFKTSSLDKSALKLLLIPFLVLAYKPKRCPFVKLTIITKLVLVLRNNESFFASFSAIKPQPQLKYKPWNGFCVWCERRLYDLAQDSYYMQDLKFWIILIPFSENKQKMISTELCSVV